MFNHTNRRRSICIGCALAGLGFLSVSIATAQEAPVVVPAQGGRPSPEQMKAIMEAQRAAQQGAQPGAQPPAAKPDDKDKKPEGEKKKDEAGESVKRPEKPPRTPDPREFEVALDDKGRVPPFNFIGQPWPDVMQWLANLSKSSLDWQELPNGYLNLTTQRSYTLDEVHDLINQALHARGFTSIQTGEVLSVFKLDKLDPAQVRQVGEEELYNLNRYDFVKVSFDLPSTMEVDKAKDDVKQVLSPSAKVFPLVTTKRLLIIDTVANLRTVSELLNQERMVQDGRIVPREFVLRYARPQQVIETLYVILGVDPKAKPAQTDPQQMQQQIQMMQQMQQQGKDMSKMMPKADAPKVYLAFNRQRNSVLANAPPEEMKKIERTIELLDVPYGGGSLVEASEPGRNGNERTMKKYPLTTLDPDNFVLTLTEIGGLSPFAEFKVDSKSKTLFALATEEDHEKINGLIDQFDGTGRKFKVIPLRLPADAVAATIYKLMAGQQEAEEEERPRYYWDYYDRDRNKKKDKPVQGFGVDADIENNRLLLWANDAELERVHELLVELGEIPTGQHDPRPVRFIQPGEKPTAELLQQLRDAWKASGGIELIIKAPPKPAMPAEKDKAQEGETEPAKKTETDRAAGTLRPHRIAAQFAQLEAAAVDAKVQGGGVAAPADEPATPMGSVEPEAPQSGAPVTITVTDDGRLMLSSPDTAALDRMEALIEELTPPERRFKVFPIKYIKASDMWYDLNDYFEDDLKEDSGGYTRDWYGFMIPKGSKDTSTGLAKRRKLMITWDVPSNSILVANASPSQLAEIRQLIDTFDKPPRADSVEIRQTQPIKVLYSKPSIIAAAIKEVYRDLLSSKDKEFDRGGDQKEQRTSAERVTVINYGGGSDSGSDRQSPVKVGFDGALSLGADDVSGMLVVSAQRGIFDDIVRMVRELDAEAAPKTTVLVHRVNGNVTAQALQKAIDQAVGKPWLGGRPEPTGTGAQAEQKPSEGDKNRDRGDRHHNGDNNKND